MLCSIAIITTACCVGCGTKNINNCPGNASSTTRCDIVVGDSPPDSASSEALATGSSGDESAAASGSPQDNSPVTENSPSSPGPSGSPLAPQPEYLSDTFPVDQDQKAGTADFDEGAYTADGASYSHAIKMDPGCQAGDGGDYYADWNLDRSWTHLSGTVALSDDAPTGSQVSWVIYLDNSEAASGSLGLGQSAPISLNVTGTYRIRLWMNDPNSPKDECGFGGLAPLVWGNLTVSP
jgi:hypothetical protein